MYRLNRGFFVFLVVVSIISCKPLGPLTPGDAFLDLKEAFNKSDSDVIVRLLSEKSIKKIITTTNMFSRMNNKQLGSLSKIYSVPAERMKKLTVKEYIKIYCSDKNRNVVKKALKYNITSIDISDNRAKIQVENGMELFFEKEGPYWKFDMSEL